MSGTAIKLVAMIAMLLDHVAQFVPGMPQWLHWIGRISAPVFLFCLIIGMEHTRNRFRYLTRLYVGGAVMGMIDFGLNLFIEKPYAPMSNNFFTSLFLVGILIAAVELYREDRTAGRRLFVIFGIAQVVSITLCLLVPYAFEKWHLEYLINGFLPNVLSTEGGFLIVILGLLFYWYRKDTKWMAGTFAITCVMYVVLVWMENKMSFHAVLYKDCQWMMVLAIPFLLLYNGKKGAGLKYLFYAFYPIHLVALFLIGNGM